MPALNGSLHAAAEDGDIDTLNRFLADGEPVDDRDPEGRTPLMYAIHGGQTDAVRHLLKWGAAVDSQTPRGLTPLCYAAHTNAPALVRLLLARGADVNQLVQAEAKPMSVEEADSMVTLLARRDASLSAGQLPMDREAILAAAARRPEPHQIGPLLLMSALQTNNLEVVTMLLDAGIDVRQSISHHSPFTNQKFPSFSPLHFAISQSSPAIVQLLIERGADVHAAHDDSGNSTPLLSAVMRGDVTVVRILLEAGANPNAGDTPVLHLAIVRNDFAMAELLLSLGASIVTGEQGISAKILTLGKPEMREILERFEGTDWHSAVTRGDMVTVSARLSDGTTDVNIRNDKGKTALLLACESGQTEMVRLLIEHGADVNAKDSRLQTPTMCAVMRGDADLLRLLIEKGGDLSATNATGLTALYSTRTEEKRELRELLLAAGAEYGIIEAAYLGCPEDVLRFLESGIPADTRNAAGMTAFMASASRGDLDLAATLHERYGADAAATNKNGETALHYAALSGDSGDAIRMMRALIEWGSPVNAEGDNGQTALSNAISVNNGPRMELLLEHGAEPNRFRKFGQGKVTEPLLRAAVTVAQTAKGDTTAMRILLNHGADANAVTTVNGEPHSTVLLQFLQDVSLFDEVRQKGETTVAETTLPILRLLIERGADVNTAMGMTNVLHSAIQTGSVQITRLLLDAGARIEAGGAQELVWAEDFPEISSLLRERGASEASALAERPSRLFYSLSSITSEKTREAVGKRVKFTPSPWKRWSGAAPNESPLRVAG